MFVGGGQIFGPTKRNYDQKINKKQKILALKYAINEHAKKDSIFLLDKLSVESGKTKDAVKIVDKLKQRDTLIVVETMDEKTYLSFRNIQKCYMIEKQELNAYLVAAYRSVLMEKTVMDSLTKEV